MTFDDDGPHAGAGALPRGQGAGGGGGKGGGSASSAPDTLFSTATVRLVDLLGEGEIVGVRGGLKGVYLNDVPVQNADGSFNFKGLTAEFRVGTPDQPYMAGYPDVQTPRNVGIKVNAATPVTVSISDTDVDRLRVTIQVPSLFLAKSDGSVKANSVSYRVQARYSGGPWVNALGDQTITGKTTSGYFRSHEIALPINPSGASAPWQVQVVRLSPDTDDFNNSQAKFTNQSDLVFYSTTSIVDARFGYPHSALVGLTAQAASFGSSVPGRTYLVDGVLMPIPSNYDPVARTYAGVWDGTFKEGFSNNPAWALNLILRNDRFGLGEFIDTAAIDKWSLYEIGRYCDVPVSDGKGGQEPRYVFNGAISTQQEAFELLQLIAQVFRGTVYWSSGTVTAAQDRPSDPVLLVTEANAIEGENGEVFAYASSGRRARHTVALVAWNDPDNLYKQTIEVVEDSDGVARYGYNPTRIDLLGCTSRGQAHRTGLWTLFTELHQTQVLTYRAGLDHAVIRPGDIVAVQDPQIANLDLSGRLQAGSSASVLVLDRPVTLASGAAYTISVVMPDGTVQEREISTGAGTVSSVTLRSALPQAPDAAAVWLIAGPVEPQLFRVVSIREEEPHIYAVAALQHEPGKYATIDDGAAFESSPITEFPNIVLPPTNLSVRESQYTELGQPKQAMTLSWTASQPFNSVAYYVTVIRPSGATVTTRTASQSIDFLEAEVGVWTFVVVAIGLNGKSSLPAQTTYTLSGWAGQAATTVAGLSVKGGGSTFAGRSCTVAWTNQIAASVPSYPVRNAVYVFDASTQVMVHREVLPAGVTEWTYDYFLNVNEGGPRRRFRIGVTAYSAAGDEGPPSYLTVSNPAPEIIVPTLGSTSEVLFVDLPKVADADFAGYLVWISEMPNINPLTAPSYDVAGNSFPYRGVPDKTYYVRAAAYDAFSKDPAQLNVSVELSKKLTILLFDPLAPAIPGQPTLASNISETAPDGTVTSKVTIAWPAVTGSNFGFYEAAIAEGSNPADGAYRGGFNTSGTSMAFPGLMPGRVYSFRVRATPRNGFAVSGWSPVLVVTAAANSAPPANPAGVSVRAAFERVVITFTPPANKDLAYIEVVAAGGSFAQDQPTDGFPMIGRVPYGDTQFWDSLDTGGVKTYWLRSVNTSGVPAISYVRAGTGATPAIQAAQIAAGIIDATKLASSLAANTVVTALPASKITDYVTFGGQQYRWDAVAGSYTKAVSASDIAGKVSAAQIDTINAGQIAGQVQAAQIAAVEASKITGQMNSGQIASLDAAKVAGTLTAANLDTQRLLGTIAGTQIAAGAITTSKLAVVSANMAYNPDASQGTRGWFAAGTMPGSSGATGPDTDPGNATVYAPAGHRAIYVNAVTPVAGTAGTYHDLRNRPVDLAGNVINYPCTAGNALEFSACISAHRCTGRIWVGFVNSANDVIAYFNGSAVTNWLAARGSYADFPKSKLIVTAPAGAIGFFVFFRMDTLTGADPFMFVSALMIAATTATATETSPYVAPGITTIDGNGIITRSLTASKLVAESITAGELAANAITTAKIAAGAVVTAHMTAGSINADRLVAQSVTTGLLAANAVTADKVSANSITAGKLLLADTSNMLLNGDFLNGSSEKWFLQGDAYVLDTNDAANPGGRWRAQGTSAHTILISEYVQVSPGDTLYVSAMMWNSRSAGNGGFYLEYANQDGTVIAGRYPIFRSEKNQWVRLEGRDLVPNGVQKVRCYLFGDNNGTGLVHFGKIQMRRAANASLIVDGAIETRTIAANAVTADKIVSNAITTAHISAGAVKADQIAAGAIAASKLAINGANMAFNPDYAQGLRGWSRWDGWNGVDASALSAVTLDSNWNPSGFKSAYVLYNKSLSQTNASQAFGMLAHTVDVNGNLISYPINGGTTYEFSAFMSLHRCQGRIYVDFVDNSNNYVGNFNANLAGGGGIGGSQQEYPRCKLIAKTPASATRALVYFMAHTISGDNPYIFVSGFMMAATKEGATETSPYEAPSATLIDGGNVFTDSLHANRIVANSITTDRLQAGTINVDTIAAANTITTRLLATDVLTATNIKVTGEYRLSNWAIGTTINGGAIAASTIAAQSLRISTRGITPVNINFYMERDGNGTPNGVLAWTGGQIEYIDDNGNRGFAGIPAGRVGRGSDGWVTIWWNKTAPGSLQGYSGNFTTAVFGDPNCILVATSADLTGVTVNWGGTIIDGDKIVARSIQAQNIAANAIQTQHMAANSISGDRIQAGTLVADRVAAGTINTGNINIGSGACVIDSGSRMLRMFNEYNGMEQVSIGQVGRFYGYPGDAGIVIRKSDGNEVFRVTGAGAWMTGAIIGDLTVTNAKIENLTLGNEKVQSEAITRGAFAAGGAGNRDVTVGIGVRNPGTRIVIWVARTGTPGERNQAGSTTGLLNILAARPGGGWEYIRRIPNAYSFEFSSQAGGNFIWHMPTSDMCMYVTPEAGYYQFRVTDESGASNSAVSICAVEFSK